MISPSNHAALRRGTTVLSLLAGMVLGRAPAVAQSADAPRFPTLRGSNLSGRAFTLPRDFEGRLNLVFVAWQREQQEEVDSWLPYVKTLAFQNPELRVYELPTVARGYVLMSPFIEAGMRGGVTDRAARDATITLYTNTERFRAALGLPHGRTIYALLVDEAGVVRWRTEGSFTREKAAAMEAAVDRLLAMPPAGSRSR